MTLTSGLEAHVIFSAILPQGHLASLSWWEEATGPEQRFMLDREALSILAAAQCESLYVEHLGILAGGNSLQITIHSHLSSQRQKLVFEQYKNNRNKMGKEPKKT